MEGWAGPSSRGTRRFFIVAWQRSPESGSNTLQSWLHFLGRAVSEYLGRIRGDFNRQGVTSICGQPAHALQAKQHAVGRSGHEPASQGRLREPRFAHVGRGQAKRASRPEAAPR